MSIVVPTYQEASNLRELIDRIFRATGSAGIDAEVIVVDDDSRDGTEEIIADLARDHPVRLIVRYGRRSLSTAVLEGFAAARHDRFLVLDADLQHPPELIPDLLARLDEDACDFVIGSRYAPGGGIDGGWPVLRRLASLTASVLAWPLAKLSDPMSGLFAVRRETLERSAGLNPIGYKIALEIYVKAGCANPAEVPIRFATRKSGRSKFGLRELVAYVRHLSRLYRFRYPRLVQFVPILLLAVLLSIVVFLAA